MLQLKVLIEGIHHKIEGILHASSTVTLVRSEGKNILVDSGSFGDRGKLIDALGKEGLAPKDIDIVIVTHTHLDHTANLSLFENARIYAKHSPASQGAMFFGNNAKVMPVNLDNNEIAKDVRTILTPGHLEAHLSVIVKTKEGTYVLCGDAIQTDDHVDIGARPKRAWNWDEYEKSRERILQMADYVVPGHGGIIRLKKS